MTDTMTKHAITRVRHQPRRRLLTVQTVERLTPAHGADHARRRPRRFRQRRVRRPRQGVLPAAGPRRADDSGAPDPPPRRAERSPGRDYTPRRYDVERAMVIDFALHDAGPATDWAVAGQARTAAQHRRAARIVRRAGRFRLVSVHRRRDRAAGDRPAVGGAARRTRAIVVAAVTGRDEQQSFESRAAVETVWVHRPLSRAEDPAPLLDAVRALTLPQSGDGYAWAAGESQTAKLLRRTCSTSAGSTRPSSRRPAIGSAARSASTRPTTTDRRGG